MSVSREMNLNLNFLCRLLIDSIQQYKIDGCTVKMELCQNDIYIFTTEVFIYDPPRYRHLCPYATKTDSVNWVGYGLNEHKMCGVITYCVDP